MFDINQSAFDDSGDWDDGAAEEYCNGLMEAFAASPEGEACADQLNGVGWVHSFLYYGLNYLGQTPPEMSPRDVEEIVFELIPRKVSVEAAAAGEIVTELCAFWNFLGREYELPQAGEIAKNFDNKAEEELRRALSDPANFGMAKSFFMMGQEAGFDMTSEQGMNQFMLAYNASLLAGSNAPGHTVPNTDDEILPPAATKPKQAPILTAKQRKARNKLRKKMLNKSKRRRHSK